jgi:hypothetical protein
MPKKPPRRPRGVDETEAWLARGGMPSDADMEYFDQWVDSEDALWVEALRAFEEAPELAQRAEDAAKGASARARRTISESEAKRAGMTPTELAALRKGEAERTRKWADEKAQESEERFTRLAAFVGSDQIGSAPAAPALIDFLERHQFRATKAGAPPKRFRPYLGGNERLIDELRAGQNRRAAYRLLADLIEGFRLMKVQGHPAVPLYRLDPMEANLRLAAVEVDHLIRARNMTRPNAISEAAERYQLGSVQLTSYLDGKAAKKYRPS